jgi:hypothetical protein
MKEEKLDRIIRKMVNDHFTPEPSRDFVDNVMSELGSSPHNPPEDKTFKTQKRIDPDGSPVRRRSCCHFPDSRSTGIISVQPAGI